MFNSMSNLIRYSAFLVLRVSAVSVVSLILIKVFFALRSAQRYSSFAQVKGNLIFGNLFELLPFFGDKTHLVRSTLDRYSNEFGDSGYGIFWLSWFPVIGVIDYDKTQEILVKPSILDKGFPFEFLRYCISDGILCSTTAKWKARKRMIRPKFTAVSVSNFIPIVQSKGGELIDRLSACEGLPLDVTRIVSPTSLSILTRVTLGVDLEGSELVSLEEALKSFIKNTLFRSINPFLWPEWSFDLYARLTGLKRKVSQVDQMITQTIVRHLNDRRPGLPSGNSSPTETVDYRAALDEPIMVYLLDQLLKEPGLSVEEAIKATVEEMETLFIAGFDGPNNALVWLVYVLGLHEDVQEKIYSEVKDCDDHSIDLNLIKQWTFTEQCVKEILRLFPPAPFATRVVTADEPFDGKIIPKDTFIFFSIYSIHRNEKIYPDPVKFSPDRFDPDASSFPSGSYLPFGLRPRDCIGQRFAMVQMKMLIAIIVKNFRIVSTKPVEEIAQEIDFTLKPTEPLKSIFHRRESIQG